MPLASFSSCACCRRTTYWQSSCAWWRPRRRPAAVGLSRTPRMEQRFPRSFASRTRSRIRYSHLVSDTLFRARSIQRAPATDGQRIRQVTTGAPNEQDFSFRPERQCADARGTLGEQCENAKALAYPVRSLIGRGAHMRPRGQSSSCTSGVGRLRGCEFRQAAFASPAASSPSRCARRRHCHRSSCETQTPSSLTVPELDRLASRSTSSRR